MLKYIYILVAALAVLITPALGQSSRIQSLAQAIARTEGFGVKHAIPTRYHNPGNLRPHGVILPGQHGLSPGGYAIFKTDADGWAALENQLLMILEGRSKMLHADMSIRQFAKRYATNWQIWAKNVSKQLG